MGTATGAMCNFNSVGTYGLPFDHLGRFALARARSLAMVCGFAVACGISVIIQATVSLRCAGSTRGVLPIRSRPIVRRGALFVGAVFPGTVFLGVGFLVRGFPSACGILILRAGCQMGPGDVPKRKKSILRWRDY